MSETRSIATYNYGDLPPEKRTPDKAKITITKYIVSDEELAEEKRVQRMANILKEIDDLKAKVKKLEDNYVPTT